MVLLNLLKYRLIIVKRVKPIPYGGVIIPIVSLITGILLSAIILWVLVTIPPLELFSSIAHSVLSPVVLKSFIMLSLIGLALVISFRGAVWNIGGEGQIMMGVLVSTYIALFTALGTMPIVSKIVMVILAAIAGALWAAIAGILRAYLGVDEVPITLLMNYIAYYIIDTLVNGPWKGKHTWGYIRTDEIPRASRFITIPGTTITVEAVILLIVVYIAAWYILNYTSLGLRIRILGSNPDLLKSAGINVPITIILALTISGAIAGIVGAIYLAGIIHRIPYPIEAQTANYGYTGILVAWLSMLDLRAVPIAAYIVGILEASSIRLARAAVMYIFMGTVLLTYTVTRIFSEYTIKFVKKM